MSDTADVDVERLRALAEDRASRGVTQVTVPTRGVIRVLSIYDALRDQLAAAQRTIAFMQANSLLPETYERGRLAGIEEEKAAAAKRIEAATAAVAGFVDDLAQGESG